MFPHARKHAARGVAIAFLAVGLWLAIQSPATSQTVEKPKEDSLGYTARFERELRQIGKITPDEFARRFPQPTYLDKIGWDPTTAKFWDDFNRDPKTLPSSKRFRSDFRLNDDELAR